MSLEHSKARAIADLAEGTILAVVEIAASPERLFRALTSPEVVEWWGQAGIYRTTDWTGDLRVGGRWRSSGVGADGVEFAVEGEFVEVDPPRRLSYTWQPSWSPGKTTTVHFRFDPIEGGTRLTLRHDGFSAPESCEAHSHGWPRILDWLSAHAGVRPTGAPSHFLIRLLPPRPTFMQTMTTAEREVMRDHGRYWEQLLGEGTAVAFGPVGDPKGGWGIGIVEVDDPGRVNGLIANDPAQRSGMGFAYEVLPILRAIVRSR